MRRKLLALTATTTLLAFLILARSPDVRADDDSAKLYKTNCVICHAADGSGNTPSGKALKAKDIGSSEVQKATDAEIAAIFTNGKNKMPAFGKKLKPEEIKQLVAYVRALAKK